VGEWSDGFAAAVDAFELGGVFADLQCPMIRVAVKVLEVDAGLKYGTVVIDLVLKAYLSPFDIETDGRSLLSGSACSAL
jgi:hypothetical protein